jgi:Tol biopolymer transport system component
MANRKILALTGISALVPAFGLLLGACAGFGGKNKQDTAVDVASFINRSILQAVTRVTDDGQLKSYPIIAPDGSKLLYTEIKADTGQSNIMMLRNVNSSAKTPLVTSGNAFTPAWYEDSNRFLYSFGENNTRRIVRSSAAGGGRTNITGNPVGVWDSYPVIKNGVILIATLESQDDRWTNWRIYSMRENGNEVTSLASGFDPAWHPYEPKFLFVRHVSENSPSTLWEMDLRTMQETQLHETPPYNIRRPQYTYDGRHIIFQRGSEQTVSGARVTTMQSFGRFMSRTFSNTSGTEVRWQLFSITSEGASESALTEGNVDCTWPSIDADNNLYFISNATGVNSNKTEIYKARLNFE